MGLAEDSEDFVLFDRIKEAKELLDMGAITQEEFDEIKNNSLKEIYKSSKGSEKIEKDKDDDIAGLDDSDFSEKMHKNEYFNGINSETQEPTFGLGDIIGTVMGEDQHSKSERAKKSEAQKTDEKAVSQAANTAAREVTKGIMRGIFEQMK